MKTFGLIRDLRFHARETLSILVLLFLSLFLLLTNFGLNRSISSFLDLSAAKMIGAPYVVSKSALFNSADKDLINKTLPLQTTAEQTEFLTSLYSQDRSLLVEIRAVSANFPLIGQIELSSQSWADAFKADQVIVYPEVLAELNVKIGDTLKIGAHDFKIVDTIKQDPGLRRFGTGLSPRLYILKSDLEKTKILQAGSQLTERLFFEPASEISNADFKKFSSTLSSQDLFLRSARDSLYGLERALSFYQKNLNILSLLLLTLTFATLFYLLQIFYGARGAIAAQLSLWGVSAGKIRTLFLSQTSIIFAAAFVLSLLATHLLFLICQSALQDMLPEDLVLQISWIDIAKTAGFGWLMWVVLSFTIFRKWDFYNLLPLLTADTPDTPNITWRDKVRAMIGSVLPLFGLAMIVTGEWILSLAFSGSFLVAMVVIYFIAPALLHWLQLRLTWGTPLLKLIFINLSRPRWLNMLAQSALFSFIFIEIFLIHSYSSLSSEFKTPANITRPDLFIININADAVAPLEQFIIQNGGEFKFVSPFLQGRLKTLNGVPPENELFQKFPLRLSYRKTLIDSEKTIDTLPESNRNPDYPPLSVENEYAERNKLQLGDLLVLDIQGLPVKGQVASLRSVKWNSFHPNFFIQFPPGVLEDFPQSFIGVVYGWGTQKKKDYTFQMNRQFPGISIIDIGFAVDQALSLTEKLMKPLMMLFIFSGVVIMALYFFLLDHFLFNRKSELSLLSQLGASKATRKKLLSNELVLQTLFTSFVATACASVGLWLLFSKWLKIELVVMWKETLVAFALLAIVSFWAGIKKA